MENKMTGMSSGIQLTAQTAKIVRIQRIQDFLFHKVTLFFASLVLIVLAGILISLIITSWPALSEFGPGFFFSSEWDVVNQKFGGLTSIYGTLVTAVLALLIAVPISFGIAVFLTEMCPSWLRRPLGTAVELLAAVPSIIYGMFGLFVFAPLFAEYVQPALTSTIGQVPVVGALFTGAPNGIGLLCAALILAFMVVPFITSVMRDVFEIVPPVLKESAYGIGCTTWEVVTRIVLPYTQAGVVGGIMLGLGRAFGETIAVALILSASNDINLHISEPGGNTFAANIALKWNEAGPIGLSALIASGLVLFAITLVVNTIARGIIARHAEFRDAS
jgi:phosphate transport system permease protein